MTRRRNRSGHTCSSSRVGSESTRLCTPTCERRRDTYRHEAVHAVARRHQRREWRDDIEAAVRYSGSDPSAPQAPVNDLTGPVPSTQEATPTPPPSPLPRPRRPPVRPVHASARPPATSVPPFASQTKHVLPRCAARCRRPSNTLRSTIVRWVRAFPRAARAGMRRAPRLRVATVALPGAPPAPRTPDPRAARTRFARARVCASPPHWAMPVAASGGRILLCKKKRKARNKHRSTCRVYLCLGGWTRPYR